MSPSVFDFLGITFASGNEKNEIASFFGSQGDFVQLLHGNFRVGKKWIDGGKDTNSRKTRQGQNP